MKTGNVELIKRINNSLVLELIRSDQPISRAGIAKKLNLSRSTVSLIVEQLLHKQFIFEMGLGESSQEGGRPGIKLGFNPKSSYGIGVDVGGTKTLIIITDLNGEVEYKEKYETPSELEDLIGLIKRSITKSNISESRILAMGVGCPGTVNIHEGIIMDSPSLKLNNYPIGKKLKAHFSFPVFVNNDVNCATLGENWLGNGKDIKNMVFIALGTGIGSGIILNNQLIHGFSYSAGEIGYFLGTEDVKGGKINKEGDYGVLENKISGTALSKHGLSPKELLSGYPYTDKDRENEIVNDFILELSIAISNIVSLLNPEKVIIGGGVSESLSDILEAVKTKVDALTPIKTRIELAGLKTDSSALGAIAYAFQNVQDN